MLEKLASLSKKTISLPNLVFFVVPQILFWMSILHNISLPGLYYDEAGNDSNVPSIINNSLNNPQMLFPGVGIPLLSSLYQGIPATYSSWLVLSILGSNIFTIRIAHAIYGALILFFFQLLLKSLRQERRLSFLVSILFATDMAFIASYRDQYQAVLTGAPFLILSLYLTQRFTTQNKSKKLLVGAGVALGFSMYCYFPYAMFLVPLAFHVCTIQCDLKPYRKFAYWVAGVALGVMPYVLGYFSTYMWAGRNWDTFVSTIESMRTQINPLSSDASYYEKVHVSVGLLQSALTNSGNNAMILGLNGTQSLVRWNLGFTIFVLALFTALILCIVSRSFRMSRFNLLVVNSILIFFFSISFFGSRLGPWHFTPLISLAYILIFIVSSNIADLSRHLQIVKKLRIVLQPLILVAALTFLSLNFFQQKAFHEQLKASGGVGKTTSALFAMQYDALHEGRETTYFFPEWGFSTSFVMITDNRVRFSYDARPEMFEREQVLGRDIAILTWEREKAEEWVVTLESLKLQAKIETYYTRQKNEAFYKVVGFTNQIPQDLSN